MSSDLSSRSSSEPWPWLPIAATAVAGVPWGLCFQTEPRPVLAAIALGPLLYWAGGLDRFHRAEGAVGPRRRRGGARLLAGLLFGLFSWCSAIPWIASTVSTYGNANDALGALALVILSLYLALFSAAFSFFGPWLARSPTGAFLGLPALWVALEWCRAYLFSGFPWNLAAYSWLELWGALPATAWIGAHGLSFLIVLANLALWRALFRRSPAPLAVLVPIVLVLVLGAARERSGDRNAGRSGGEGSAIPIRIVQPNTDILIDPTNERIRESLDRLFRLSECRPGELLIWPESAAWPYSFDRHPQFRQRVAELTDGGCGLLLNSARADGAEIYNSALLIEGGAVRDAYDKNQLVPFGEYVPLRSVLGFVGQIARIEKGFSASYEPRLLAWRGESLGVAICFEIVFPDQVGARVRDGASLLVTLTNDAWYGDTSAPWQHLAAARFRAAENGRMVIRAAITGITAVIDRYGRIEHSIGIDEEGVLATTVRGASSRTPFSLLPRLVPATCTLGVGLTFFFHLARKRRRS